MKYRKILSPLLSSLLLIIGACSKEVDINLPSLPSQLVIDGSIELGKRAEVVVTLSAPYFASLDSLAIREFVGTRAKVSLSSPTQQEVLLLIPSDKYFPPRIFVSQQIIGELNKEYQLKVEYQGMVATASTSILPPVAADSVWFSANENKESGKIIVKITDPPNKEDYYKLQFLRLNKDKSFIQAIPSVFSDRTFSGETVEIGFEYLLNNLGDLDDEGTFSTGDTVIVQFATIDKTQYDFWNTYQFEVITAANPFSASNKPIRSNVENGLGLWGGFSAKYYHIICLTPTPDSLSNH